MGLLCYKDERRRRERQLPLRNNTKQTASGCPNRITHQLEQRSTELAHLEPRRGLTFACPSHSHAHTKLSTMPHYIDTWTAAAEGHSPRLLLVLMYTLLSSSIAPRTAAPSRCGHATPLSSRLGGAPPASRGATLRSRQATHKHHKASTAPRHTKLTMHKDTGMYSETCR